MTESPPTPSRLDPKAVLANLDSREDILLRIREIERRLEKWEREDEENDVDLMEGHIRLTRGFRFGCGTALLCVALIALRVVFEGHRWAAVVLTGFGLAGLIMIVRGLLYRPSARMIVEAYTPHRTSDEYRLLVQELEILSRALAQDIVGDDSHALRDATQAREHES